MRKIKLSYFNSSRKCSTLAGRQLDLGLPISFPQYLFLSLQVRFCRTQHGNRLSRVFIPPKTRKAQSLSQAPTGPALVSQSLACRFKAAASCSGPDLSSGQGWELSVPSVGGTYVWERQQI